MSKSFIKINGDKELQDLFNRLDVKPIEIRQVSRAAAGRVRTAARRKAPKGKTGNLRRGITVQSSRNKNYASVWIGPNYGRFKGARASHAHFVAFKFMRSNGRISTNNPIGQFIQEAASEVGAKALESAQKKYVSMLNRKIKRILK